MITYVAGLASDDGGSKTDLGPGALGFIVFIALVAAVFFLYRSMRKQIKRVEFDPEGLTDEQRMRHHQD